MPRTIGLFAALLCLAAAGPAAAQTCGNYVREAPEQCDDGNLRNLDGCDALCRFEHTQRINGLQLEFQPGSLCPGNAIGGAVLEFVASPGVQDTIAADIFAGRVNILFHLMGLDDPAAGADPAVEVGVTNGRPVEPGSMFYDGINSADWWYGVDPSSVGPDRQPIHRLPGTIAANTLTVGPGRAVVRLFVAQQPADLLFTGLNLSVPVGPAFPPLASNGLAPGHETLEHVDPALQTVASLGESTDPQRGELCGNASVASLAATPVPLVFQPEGLLPCLEGYGEAHSFLDMMVGGCHVIEGLGIEVVIPTQPDTWDPDAPILGAGPPYVLSDFPDFDGVVSGCFDFLGAEQPFQACLAAAAYSARFTFTTHRVVAAEDPIFEDGFETGDLSRWSIAATDGGDLAVTAPAAIVGAQGLEGLVNDQAGLFVQDDEPEDEGRYRASFRFDPSAFDPGEANGKFRTRMFIAFEENPVRRVMAIVLRRIGNAYSLMARVRQDDDSQVNTPFFPLTAEPHRVDFEWIRSSGPGANDGVLRLWLDGALVATLTGQDNSISSIDFVRMGALSVKEGATGTLRWDAFQATRRSPLAP